MNPVVSIICACNNQKIFKEMLAKSLEKQSFKSFEIIIIDAKEKGFKSASQTLNYGASLAKGALLIFVHQDIEFSDADSLEKLVYYGNNCNFGMIGVAGTIGDKSFAVSSTVSMGKERIIAGILNTSVTNVYSLDECLLMCKKEKFKGFDDYGTTWHFYGVEYSQRCIENNENVLIVPVNIYHDSYANSLDKTYFDTLKLYCKKHKNQKLIRTCCGYFKNNSLLPLYCAYRKFKLFIKRLIKNRKHSM